MAKTKSIQIAGRDFTIRKLTFGQIEEHEERARTATTNAGALHVQAEIIRSAIQGAGAEPPGLDFFKALDPEDLVVAMGEVMRFSHLVERGEAKSP